MVGELLNACFAKVKLVFKRKLKNMLSLFSLSLTFIEPDLRVRRSTCSRYGQANATGIFYGQRSLIQSNRADMLTIPFPIDLKPQLMDYSPVIGQECTTLMNVYNETYVTHDLVDSFDAFKGFWTPIFSCVILIALVYFMHGKQAQLNFITALFTSYRTFMTTHYFPSNVSEPYLVTAIFSFACFALLQIFSSEINAKTVVPQRTARVNSLQELLESNVFRPIWIANAMTVSSSNLQSAVFRKVQRRLNNTGPMDRQKDLTNYRYVTDRMRKDRRALISITNMVTIASRILTATRVSNFEHIHISDSQIECGYFAFGYRKEFDRTSRDALDQK